ncbi:AA_permease_2 domain-containing protein [Cephalotus follicularis]|uniref:AA_permease_2 domain-containing protein n=1 Tax=Cephalotus follicularis TaxID=3775 RepID=A0A1Q3CED4_CEPFO|nr:AA_permease_2 domain-containing protein [Cephalotus follicularis]
MEGSSQHLDDQEQQPLTAAAIKKYKKLSLIPLVFLIYFEVSGGPYGVEPTVKASGPLFAILGFLIFPFIWSIPEALVTAELATAFPGNGGFVLWADKAFGPMWGTVLGSWKYHTGVINLATYPALCINYLQMVFPILSSELPRYIAMLSSTLLLSFLNYTGVAIVGYAAVTLGIISLSPFILLTLISIPKIDPARWFSLGQKGVEKDWTLYFNTLLWNLNFWDSASTLAAEVEHPQKTFPKALLYAGLLTCLGYLIPLLAATGAIPLDQQNWVDGYFAEVAEMIAGKWLKYYIEFGAVLSIIGLYEAQLSSCVYQLAGMADIGILPVYLGLKSAWFGTPWWGILVSTLLTIAVSFMSFTDIMSSANFLYSLGMFLEFASFLWLRRKFPEIERPFRVPLGLPALVVMCLIPSGFLFYVMVVASAKVYLLSTGLTISAFGMYFALELCKSKKWIKFNNREVKLGVEDL